MPNSREMTPEELVQQLVTLEEYERQLHKNIRQLLTNVAGEPVVCRGSTCEAEVWWVQHAKGRRAPYTEAALNHFIDCPNADEFRRGR